MILKPAVHVVAARARTRCLSSLANTSHRVPWFVSPDDDSAFPFDIQLNEQEQKHSTPQPLPIPDGVPDHLRTLHTELCTSPYLEVSSLRIMRPPQPLPAPPLPFMRPRGSRRKRGGTDAGVGIDMPTHGIWSWFVLAQVKEGTERKGSINNVVQAVRKTLRELASRDPSLVLPPNRRQLPTDGWAMLDVGDFAVHIVSRSAKEKWFWT